ncbi:Crp/Fnr family transcriptional regulator [Tenacibaculum sp. 190524A02b]|uniref:Catabolite gene activator protein n=1 Tax=Tenacibaculum vairaonense TaxID=3137860 RepID=A0ABM9PHW9_9FLAO
MSYTLLRKDIEKYLEFTDNEFYIYKQAFVKRAISKKKFLLRQGEICSFEGFVTQGCFRIFTLDESGNEHTLYFAIEDWWITDIDSFTNQIPSLLSIQALEDSEVLLVSKKEKDLLFQKLPKVEKLFRIMTQKTIVALQRRMIRKQSLTAEKRYLYFLEKYPKIAHKLTNVQLASYLGISHEFLSKIRKKVVRNIS